MTKVAIITDTHFGVRNDNVYFMKNMGKFFDEIFFPYLLEHNIDTLIHMGDIFDRRKYVNFHTLNYFRDCFFDKLHEYGIEMYTCVGNHDVYYKNTNSVNSVRSLLGEYKNIHIYDNVAEEVKIKGKDFLFIPWLTVDNGQKSYEVIENTDCKIAFGHLEISGYEMHKGAICEHGESKDVYSKFDMVYTGHFHTKNCAGNISYLGTPYEMTFSDCGEEKGFHILDIDTNEIEYITNPNRMFYKAIYIEGNTYTKEYFNKFNSTYVKVIVSEATNPKKFSTFLDTIYAASPLDVTVVEEKKIELDNNTADVKMSEDTLTILNAYVDDLVLDMDKNRLKTLLKEIYLDSTVEDRE